MGKSAPSSLLKVEGLPMSESIYNVLFLCTGNSSRSILAESILTNDGAGRFRAFSAGSHPAGVVNLLATKVLKSRGYPTEGLRSKSWDEFAGAGAPVMDFVFTVCNNAAAEICPVWPGQPVTARWGIEDPGHVHGTDIEREAAFDMAFCYLERRISLFRSLPLERLDQSTLAARLREIGEADGAAISCSDVA
jgi:arsenate reductase (thioredoxin)